MRYRLEQLFDLQMGKTPSRNKIEYWNTNDNKWISIGDLAQNRKYISKTKEYISDNAVRESGIKIIPANTVIMSFKLSIGKVAITKENMYSNEAIMAFHDKHVVKLLPEYIYYLFKYKDWSEGTNKAVMGKTLNKATLAKVEIDICSIQEQTKIVEILDKALNILNDREKQLFELDMLIKSRFVEMFGDTITNPMGWDKASLGDICDVRDGTHDSPKYYETGYPLVTSKNVTAGKIDLTDCSLISKEDYDRINVRSNVDHGDIIMPMIGTVGKPVIVDVDVDFAIKNVALIKFYDDTKVSNIYVKSLLESDYFDKAVMSRIRGGTQKFIALGDIRKLKILLPEKKVQDEFISFVRQTDKSRVAVQKALDETQLLFDSLMQKYFG